MALVLSCVSCGKDQEQKSTSAKHRGQRVIIIGFDGMDPLLLRKFLDEGKMPHFKKLIESGGDFLPLTSSVPPQSPVAWSNFTTGCEPGKHGIYDFIHRNPKTYIPDFSLSRTEQPDEKKSLVIGRRVIWWDSGKVELLRRGKPFWEYLADEEISARIMKVPSNFPPWPGKAWTTTGMGTPDMTGGYGRFTFFTDFKPEHPKAISGGTIVPVWIVNNKIETGFKGPDNIYQLDRKFPYQGTGDKRERNYAKIEVPVTIYLDKKNPQIKIEYQDQEIMMAEGEWSDWHPIKFAMWPRLVEVKGIVRFYLKELPKEGVKDSAFRLYASPINMDPAEPPLPVADPPEYGKLLAEEVGPFYTQGMPEDTKARQANLDIFNDGELFHQMMIVYDEDLRMLKWHLDHFEDGLMFYYFSSLDQGTHMFWRLHDPTHPAYDPEWAKKLGDPVELLYRKMDYALGTVMEKLDENTTLIVMSDHGFGPYKWSFELNAWLLENGYLKLKMGSSRKGADIYNSVDWERSQAYGLGFNGLYINREGRESEGSVPEADYRMLVDEIAEKLLAYETCEHDVDSETCERPVLEVYKAYEVYHGDYVGIAPDLVVGYKRGFRGGDDSALGDISENVIEVNTGSWSGDHCIATSEVPGIIVTNRKIIKSEPALIDIGPTVLEVFGLPVPADMDGKPLF